MPWSRETRWRQGRVLSPESFERLGISKDFPGYSIALVISHDCDIANDNLENEPNVEFILGKTVDACEGNNEYGKNPRILHLNLKDAAAVFVFELHAAKKILIPKEELTCHEPDESISLDRRNLEILCTWLSARYNRQALPDSLNVRLSPIARVLEKEGKKHLWGILGCWIDYQPRDVELPPEQAYELWIQIVYSVDDRAYEDSAEAIAKSLRDNFSDLTKKSAPAGRIELRGCEAFSEEEFTLKDLRESIRYRLEYLSYRQDPPGPVV